MKKAFKLSAIVAFLFATSVIMGADPKVKVDKVKKTISIELEKSGSENLIRLVDPKNRVIYYERLDEHAVGSKTLDFTELPIGSYVLKLENPLRTAEYGISVEKLGVSIISEKIDNKPRFRKRGGKVFLNLLNSDSSPVDISVRDAMDRLLFSEKVDGKFVIAKAFNFERAFAGSYTIRVKDGESVHFEEIVVN
ncbi:MAG: hypothetical protein WBG48_07050 [Pricia sp.]